MLAEGLEIFDAAMDGRGVARKDDMIIFVEESVPGDVVDAFVMKERKNYLVGRIQKIITPSAKRVEPACQHFGICGGCKWQNMGYEHQLYYKQKQVTDAMQRIGHVTIGEVRPILGSVHPWRYRNKMDFTFANRQFVPSEKLEGRDPRDFPGSLGFHISRHFDRVVEIEECHLHIKSIDAIRNEVRRFTLEEGMVYLNVKDQTGLLKNLMFRTSDATGELMVILIIGEDDRASAEKILNHILAMFPGITSAGWVHNYKNNPSIADLEYHPLKGPSFITEHLGPWKYRISPTSFFQTNTQQAKVLYDVTRSFVGGKTGIIYDLYCGAGSIGIYVNDLADKIIGVEYVQDAVADAEENLKMNGLTHLEFYAGDMKAILSPAWVQEHGRPDVIITDPPRAGMDEPVVRALLEIAAPRIVYVSCNAATQARDIAILAEKYEVKVIQPVDMFPHTSHVENVALLELRGQVTEGSLTS